MGSVISIAQRLILAVPGGQRLLLIFISPVRICANGHVRLMMEVKRCAFPLAIPGMGTLNRFMVCSIPRSTVVSKINSPNFLSLK